MEVRTALQIWLNAILGWIDRTSVRIYLLVLQGWNRMASTREAQSGQSMVEYALLAALIAVALIVAIQALTGSITAVFDRIVTRLNGVR